MNKRLTAIIRARITDFKKKMAEVKAISEASASSITKRVDANTRNFTRKMAKVKKEEDLQRKRSPVLIAIEARTQKFTQGINKSAHILQSFAILGQHTIGGVLTSVFSAGIPVIASMGTAIASLGPILGVAAGGALGLASGLGAASAGVLGFGAVAIPTLSKVFKAESSIKKAQDAVNNAATNKAREKAIDKLNAQWASLSKSEVTAVSNLESFKVFWANMTKQFQNPVFDIFAGGLQAVTTILQKSQPIIAGSVKAVNTLVNSLNQSLNSPDIEEFFEWLGRSAGPALVSFGKIAGNTLRGIFNLFVAFDPLAKNMETGLQNLTKRFAEWTSGLKTSDKFQAFITYVETNGPKLLNIVGNITDGLVGMFTGFAPTSANMITGLEKLTAKFKTWGQTLSQNKAFQNFIDYVQTNGPHVIALIGNLSDNISDLAKGMAPLGASVLKAINHFLKWTDAMMGAHPALAKVLGVVISLTGALRIALPFITTWRTAFGTGQDLLRFADAISDLIIKIGELSLAMISSADDFITKWVAMGAEATKNAAIAAGAWAKTTGKQTALAVASMAKASATFIAKWVAMGAKSLAAAARIATAWLISMGPIPIIIAAIVALVALVVLNWGKIKSVTITVFNAVWSFIKKVWNSIKSVFTTVVGAIKNFLSSAWNAIKKVTTTVFTAIWSFLKSIWSKTAGWIASKAEAIWSSIKSAWDKAENFLKNINLVTVGKHIITGLINGIKNEGKKLWGTVKSIAGSISDGFMHFMHMGSPSRLMRDTIGKWIVQGIGIGMIKNVKSVISAARQVSLAATPNLTDFSMPQTTDVNGGLQKLRIASSFSKKTNTPAPQPPPSDSQGTNGGYAIINIGGYEAKGVITYITDEQARQEKRSSRFGGRR